MFIQGQRVRNRGDGVAVPAGHPHACRIASRTRARDSARIQWLEHRADEVLKVGPARCNASARRVRHPAGVRHSVSSFRKAPTRASCLRVRAPAAAVYLVNVLVPQLIAGCRADAYNPRHNPQHVVTHKRASYIRLIVLLLMAVGAFAARILRTTSAAPPRRASHHADSIRDGVFTGWGRQHSWTCAGSRNDPPRTSGVGTDRESVACAIRVR